MKIKFSVLMLCLAASVMNCGDDDDDYSCKTCVDVPEAVPANDASGKGIYKGVVVGSSGTIKINVANTGSAISGVLVIDGKTITLTPENDGVFNEGYEGYLVGTMTVTDDVLVWFEVNATGTQYAAAFALLPGHPDAVIQILKEYSDLLIQSFEGTFSGDESGTFNLVLFQDEEGDGEWYAVSKDSEEEISYHYGEIEDDEMSADGTDVVVVGEIDDDEVSGTWATPATEGRGNWKGKRTL